MRHGMMQCMLTLVLVQTNLFQNQLFQCIFITKRLLTFNLKYLFMKPELKYKPTLLETFEF